MFLWIKGHIGWLLGLSILVMACVFLLYSWVDVLVSLDYSRQEQEYQRREIAVLQSLLLEMGKRMSRFEIEQLVKNFYGKDHLIKKDEKDELSIDNIILRFEDDSLVDVKSLNE